MLHPFMYPFLIYTPVMSMQTAFFQERLNIIVIHRNDLNL